MGFEFPNVFCWIHSLRSLSYERFSASSKASSPQSANLCSSVKFAYLFTLTSSSGYLIWVFFVTSNFHSIAFLRGQFLREVWPIQLTFLLFIVRRIFLSSLILCNAFSFPTWSGKLIYSILLQHHVSKRSGNFWSTFRSVQVSASHSALVQM